MKLGKTSQRILTLAALLVAVALLAIGSVRKHDAFFEEKPKALVTEDAPAFGGPFGSFGSSEDFIKALAPKITEYSISDFLLTEAATFTGAQREADGVFRLTFDPTIPRGKQACPT